VALAQSGRTIQDKKLINLSASLGVAVRKYATAPGPVDYILLVDQKPVGVFKAKRPQQGAKLI